MPGAVSFAQGRLFVWDGGTKLEPSAPTLPVRATIDGTLAAPLADLFAAWCELAGLGLSRVAPDVDSALALHGVDSAPEHEATLALGAANVRVRFAGATQAREEASERMPWLMVDGATIVDWRPGEIRTTITSFEFVSGDRAAIAVAWGELFDGAVRLPSAVVPLTERSAAGDPRRSGGLDAPVDRGHEPASLAALFAAAAAALVLLAWLVRARSA